MTKLQKEILQVLKNSRRVMSTREIAEELKKTGRQVNARGVDNAYSFYRGYREDDEPDINDLSSRPGLPCPSAKDLRRKWEILRAMLKFERKTWGKDQWGVQRRLYLDGVLPHIDQAWDLWHRDVTAWRKKHDPNA